MTPVLNLRRIHDVTNNYRSWQGLRRVPGGAGLCLFAVLLYSSATVGRGMQGLIGTLIVGVAVGSSFLAGAHYRRRFGRVVADRRRRRARRLLQWGVAYPVVIGATLIDASLTPPIIVSALVCAVAIEAERRANGRGRLHYVGASTVLAASAFLPVVGLVSPGIQAIVFVLAAVGLILVIGGVLDHRAFVRSLAPAFLGTVRAPRADAPVEIDRRMEEPADVASLTALAACHSVDVQYLGSLTGLSRTCLLDRITRLQAVAHVAIAREVFDGDAALYVSITPRGRTAIERHWQRLSPSEVVYDSLDAGMPG